MLKSLVLTAAAVCVAAVASPSLAQDYPDRPIRMIVGFPPGGSTDLAARVLADKLSRAMGQPVVVENRSGASGNIAADAVARAAPDGYTLMLAASSFAAAPAFFDTLGWDPVKDFTPVAKVATVPLVVVVNPDVPARTLKELVAYSKANPGEINMASPGATTLTRLAGELFKQEAGLDWVTVHYKGGAPAMQDTLAGRTQVMFANISDVLSQIKAGTLTAIAVTTAERSAMLPQVPTIAESGYPDFSYSTWQAVVGPAGLPADVQDKLNAEIRKVMSMPAVKAKFLSFGTEAATGSPQELAVLLASEVAKIKHIARSVGATRD